MLVFRSIYSYYISQCMHGCSMARSPPKWNLLPLFVGSIINNFSNITEEAQWATPSCSRPQPATNNGVRDGRFNCLSVTPTLYRAVHHDRHLHGTIWCCLCRELNPQLPRVNPARQLPCLCGHFGYIVSCNHTIYLTFATFTLRMVVMEFLAIFSMVSYHIFPDCIDEIDINASYLFEVKC